MDDIDTILFDKDGTLFHFQKTWAAWTHRFVADTAGGDAGLASALAARMGFDLVESRFHPLSPVVAGTPCELVGLIGDLLPGHDPRALEARMLDAAHDVPQVPAVPLAPLLGRLAGASLKLAVVTNDGVAVAEAHLSAAGVRAHFGAVLGYDSGHGGKPGPGMLLAALDILGSRPASALMVGDSLADLEAARAAGCRSLGVLTGTADRNLLAPMATRVAPDIGVLPSLLGLT